MPDEVAAQQRVRDIRHASIHDAAQYLGANGRKKGPN
jgi:hypothetical protein